MPVYNGERHLSSAIESVLNQTHTNFELVCVDDCSTDSSAAIIERFAKQDKRIRYLKNDRHCGYRQNYIATFKLADGEYIKPFAQDDLLAANFCERMLIPLLENQEIVLAACARKVINGDGKMWSSHHAWDGTATMKGVDVICDFLRTYVNRIGVPVQVICKKDSLRTWQNPVCKDSRNMECWLHILEQGSFAYIDEELCEYRRENDATIKSSLYDFSFAADHIRLAEAYGHHLEKEGLTKTKIYEYAIDGALRKLQQAIEVHKVAFDNVANSSAGRSGKTNNGTECDTDVLDKLVANTLLYAYRLRGKWLERQKQLAEQEAELLHLRDKDSLRIRELVEEVEGMKNSGSWKVTEPLRKLRNRL